MEENKNYKEIPPLELPSSVQEILSTLPPEQKQIIVSFLIAAEIKHSVEFYDPKSDPKTIRELEELKPGEGFKLLEHSKDLEKQDALLEAKELDSLIEIEKNKHTIALRGQWFGFVIFLVGLIGAILTQILTGSVILPIIILIFTVLPISIGYIKSDAKFNFDYKVDHTNKNKDITKRD